jgi:hypothetical protein
MWKRDDFGYFEGQDRVLRVLVIRPSRGKRKCDRGRMVQEVRWVPIHEGKMLRPCSRLRDAKSAISEARYSDWLRQGLIQGVG